MTDSYVHRCHLTTAVATAGRAPARKATKSDRHKSLNCPVVATTADKKRKEMEMNRKWRRGLPLLRHAGDGGVKATGNILELWAAAPWSGTVRLKDQETEKVYIIKVMRSKFLTTQSDMGSTGR